jgi:hypothetical protein
MNYTEIKKTKKIDSCSQVGKIHLQWIKIINYKILQLKNIFRNN